MEEGGAKEFFELDDLAADGGLLNAVGHVAHGFADAAVFGDVIEEFKVVNVHRIALWAYYQRHGVWQRNI